MHRALAGAARNDAGPSPNGFLHPSLDALSVLDADHRPHLDIVVEGIADRQGFDRGFEGVDKIPVHLAAGEYSLSRDADLASVGKAGIGGGGGDLFEIGVRHDDQRGVGT